MVLAPEPGADGDGERPLVVWVVAVGEPLPLPGSTSRAWRAGVLASRLAARGHDVTWWTSTFDHISKRHFTDGESQFADGAAFPVAERLVLRFLDGTPYRRNVSFARLRNHAQVGSSFAKHVRREPLPDVIVASYPLIELCFESVRFAQPHSIPVIVDVRDLWPDIFADVVPRAIRPLADLALAPMSRKADATFRNAAAIFGVSDGYVQWGLERAGRARRAADEAFTLGYPRTPATAAAIAVIEERVPAVRSPDSLIVAFVGSFGRTYDLGPAIRAARALAGATGGPGRRAHFVFAGDGENSAAWREAARGLPNVTFTGWLSGVETAALLERAHVGLAAYAANAPQGLPNKLIEYLSFGLPVLSTLQGEARAVLEASSAGCFVEARDDAALQQRIAAYAADEELRAAHATAASALYRERFDAEGVFDRMCDRVEQIAAHGGR